MIIARTNTTAAIIRAIIRGFNELVLVPNVDGLLRKNCMLKKDRTWTLESQFHIVLV